MSAPAHLSDVVLGHFAELPAGMAGTRAGEWLSAERVSDPKTPAALAALLATLKLGPPEARAGTAWSPDLWARWGQVGRVVIGGEALVGPLGEEVVTATGAWLPRLGLHKMRLYLPQPPQYLPLFGLAGLLHNGPVIALDVAGRRIQRLRGTVADGQLVNWTPWPSLTLPETGAAQALADALAEMLQTDAAVGRIGLSLDTTLDANLVPLTGVLASLGGPVDDVLLALLAWSRPLHLTVVPRHQAAPRAFAADAALVLDEGLTGGLNPTRV